MTPLTSFDDFVLAILVGEYHQKSAATLESLNRWQVSRFMAVDVVVNRENRLDYFTFLEQVRARHPGKHLVVMHADIYFAEDFLHNLLEQVASIESAGLAWGLLGPAGVAYPYFKLVRNMVDYHGIRYAFGRPLPAIHLDGHLLVIHRDVVFDFDTTYRGFHHYDTLLCIRSWAQGLPVFTINLPLHHLGQGNVAEWQERSDVLGRLLGKTYGNKALVTSMGPVSLDVAAGTTRDFYKHDVEPTLSRCFGHRVAPEVTLVLRIDRDDEEAAHETLLSVCGQFEKPARVLVICPDGWRATFDATFRYFGDFVDLVILSPELDAGLATGDVLMGCGAAIRAALPERAVVAFLKCGTILFPNYVRDIRRFHVWGINVGGVVAALDFNYAVRGPQRKGETRKGDVHLIQSWKTETADDLVSGGVIPLASFAVPANVVRSVINDRPHGALTERVFTFKLVARAPVFFLRRLGGLERRSPAEFAPADAFAEIADHSEFLRTAYPFASLWMKHAAIAAPPISREQLQLLVMKLARYPKFIDGIFKLHGVVRRLRKWSAGRRAC